MFRVAFISKRSGTACLSPASDWCSACYNGGSCLETRFGIMCQCPRFWTGPQCKDPITCRDLPCKQASACHDYVSETLADHFACRSINRVPSNIRTVSLCGLLLCLLRLASNSPAVITAPASQDGPAPSVPSTWTSAPAIRAATAVSASINKTATTVNVLQDTLVISAVVSQIFYLLFKRSNASPLL